jgi:hypothetical protein
MCRGDSPHFVVIRSHEEVCNADTHHPHDPLVKCFWLSTSDTGLQRCVNHTVHALHLVVFWQHRDVVLERVWDPETFAADVGDTLVSIPVRLVRKSLIDAVVEIFVVGEDDMAANVVELD